MNVYSFDLLRGEKKKEPFHIIVNSGVDRQFIVPTMGISGSGYYRYNWTIDWGDGAITTHSGVSGSGSGITHTYPVANTQYKIVISPTNKDELGWLMAFAVSTTSGSGSSTNLIKVLIVGGQLTEKAIRATKSDSNVCNNMFRGCTNLQMNDTFQLPQGITSVGDHFCNNMFYSCNGAQSIIKPTQFFGNLVLNQTELDKSNVFLNTFNAAKITEDISQIPQLAVIPSTDKNTFALSTAPDLASVPENWK